VGGAVWFTVAGESFGGHERMDLLRAIAEVGSITHAAKVVGVSYKTAWDAIDSMSTLAGEPLVERSTGGRGGGSTHLTARGHRLVERFEQIDKVHRRFLKLLDNESIDLDREFSELRTVNLKTSARNQFVGTVTSVRSGSVNDEVELTLTGGSRIVATITHDSTRLLELRTGMTAFALLKSSSVMVAKGIESLKISVRNRLQGNIASVTPGAVNAEVVVDLDGDGSIGATVSQASLNELALAAGERVSVLFNASSVILAVTA
jgi:molybdate transport system regulatory protein